MPGNRSSIRKPVLALCKAKDALDLLEFHLNTISGSSLPSWALLSHGDYCPCSRYAFDCFVHDGDDDKALLDLKGSPPWFVLWAHPTP